MIDIFINEFKEKDKDISQIKLNLLKQEILSNNNTKKIINILDEIIFEINNKIVEQKKRILNKLKNDEINMKLYENIKEMQKAIHYTEESLIINKKENQILAICEDFDHTKREMEINMEEMKFNYEILSKMKDELPGIKSFKGNINEIKAI